MGVNSQASRLIGSAPGVAPRSGTGSVGLGDGDTVGDAFEAGDPLAAVEGPEVMDAAATTTGVPTGSAARVVPHATAAMATSASSSPIAAHRARDIDRCVGAFI